MFTGLIQQTGTVLSLDGGATKRLATRTALAPNLQLGGSISVNGVCLTAVELGPDSFSADLLEETLLRTTLGEFSSGDIVNLELPTPAGAPLGGHIVQGHVDAVGTVLRLSPESRQSNSWRLAISVPPALRPYVAEKGSIAIDGISLTVAAITPEGIEVSIIPHTYQITNIRTLKTGGRVNLEVDPLAKYAEQLLAAKEKRSSITLEMLIANGY